MIIDEQFQKETLKDILNEATIFSNNLVVNKIYKISANLPITKDKLKGHLIFLMSSSLDMTIKNINKPGILDNKTYTGYFFEKRLNYKFHNKIVKKVFKEQDRYMDIRSSCKIIKKTNFMLNKNLTFNTFMDMSDLLSTMFDNLTTNRDTNINEFFRLITEYINRYRDTAGYTESCIAFPVSDWIEDVKDLKIYKYRNDANPFTFIFKMIELDKSIISKLPKILFYNNKGWFMFDINAYGEASYSVIQTELKKLTMRLHDDLNTLEGDATPNELDVAPADIAISSVEKANDISSSIVNTVSPDKDLSSEKSTYDISGTPTALLNPSQQRVKKLTDDISNILQDTMSDKIKNGDEKDILNNVVSDSELTDYDENPELIESISTLRSEVLEPSTARLARETQLRDKFYNKVLNGKTVKQILAKAKKQKVESVKLKVDTIVDTMTDNKLVNFDETYNKNNREADIIAIIESFMKNKQFPLHVVDFKIEDASDSFNLYDRVTFTVEDRRGKRYTNKILLPQVIDGMFMYLGGSEKNIIKQLALKPVVKTKPDTVQISTNYKKILLYRDGVNISARVIRFKEAIKTIKDTNIKFDTGDYTISNESYIGTIEFDSIASDFAFIEFYGNIIYFNLPVFDDTLASNPNLKCSIPNTTPIGITENKELISLDTNNNKVYINDTDSNFELIDYINNIILNNNSDYAIVLRSIRTGSKFMYVKAKLMGKFVPMILLLSYSEGLTTVLKKAKIKYNIITKDEYSRRDIRTTDNYGHIEFRDGYIEYERYPYENSILLNGFFLVNTSEFSLSEIDERNTYLRFFESLYGDSRVAQYFDNFYELLLDPITLDVLEDLKLPTDYVTLMLYANALLVDNRFIPDNNLSQSRLRSAELIPDYFYNELSTAYQDYRATATNNNPKPFSIKEDSVVTRLLTEPIVEEYSSLNPMLEAEKCRTVGYKGLSGINLDRAYTIDKRVYDKSMLGNIAISSPPSGKVGVTRRLPIDVKVSTTRGYLEETADPSTLDAKNIMSPSEGMVPYVVNHDDAPRIPMASTQKGHAVAPDDADVFIMSNGTDAVMKGLVTDRFCFKAKEDGVVEEIDEANKLLIIKYKSGKKDVVDLSDKEAKNAGGGFFILNTLITDLKVGSKFKNGDAVAYNSKYFSKDIFGNLIFKSACMVNVALLTSYYTYEDSTCITEKLANRMATDVIMNKNVTLDPNTNIESIVKVGDKVKVGDPLIVFEENMTDDPEITKLLAGIGDDMQQQVSDIGKSVVKSTYAGVVHDIKIYYTCDLDEMTPSARKIVDKYRGKVQKIQKKLQEARPDDRRNAIMTPPAEKITANKGKVKGEYLENGILIEFYIKYKDIMAIGDKLTFYTALKGIVGEIIPEGKEPTLVRDESIHIDAFLSHISVDKRMTTSPIIVGSQNRVYIELKKKLKEIFYK